MQLSDLREQVEMLTVLLARGRFEAGSGQHRVFDSRPAFRQFPEVATWESFGFVREEIERSEGKRGARLKVLLHHLFRLMEDAATSNADVARQAGEIEEVSGTEAGETVPARFAIEDVARVGDRERRSGYGLRAGEALAAAGASVRREIETLQSVAQHGGYASSLSAHAALAGIDVSALAGEAAGFLDATAAMYEDVLSWWMRRTTGLKLFPHGAERHDLLHALALTSWDGLFPRGASVPALSGRLSAMGLTPYADGHIRLDAENRMFKIFRPLVAAIDPPDEVVVAFRPGRGHASVRDFLFALGTAQHFAQVDAARPFEDRVLGDQSAPRAVGELFALWLLDRGWLKRVLEVDTPDVPRVLTLVELFRCRFLAAIFLHSVQVDREGARDSGAREYAERLSRATLSVWPESLWLNEVRGRFEWVYDLRAKMLGIAWTEHLRDRFDEDWWRNPDSGPYLTKAFTQGQFEPASAVAERFGLGQLSLARVAEAIESRLELPG